MSAAMSHAGLHGTSIHPAIGTGSLAATAGSGAAAASASQVHHPPPDLTTARNIFIAFGGILALCMIVQMSRFITRLFASVHDRSSSRQTQRPLEIPPVSAMNSATFLTDRAHLGTRRRIAGGALFSGWFLRKGQSAAILTSPADGAKDGFGKTAASVDTPGPFSSTSNLAKPPPTLVPPAHVRPVVDFLPWSRSLRYTPFGWLPKPFRSSLNIPQLVVVSLYLAVCMVALLWKADHAPPLPGKPEGPDYRRTGTIALVNIPLAVALGVRGNLIGLAIGRGYEKLKTFHKIAGRVCFIASTIHIAYFTAKWSWSGRLLETSAKPKFLWAWIAWSALVLLAVSSLPWIRKRWFTLFEACHAIGIALFIAGTGMHVPVAKPWCIASAGVYGLSMLLSALKTKVVRAELLALPSSASTVITVPSLRSGWRAGQHVRVRIPALGLRLGYEGHPFTISSAPNGEGLVLMCKTNGDWTRALHRLAQGPARPESGLGLSTPTDVTMIVEGPHGGLGNTLLASFSSVMLVAGGSGITHSLALAHDLLLRAPTGSVRARTIDLVWIIRTEDIAQPLMPTLLDMVNDAREFENACRFSSIAHPTALRVHIFVTRSAPSAPLVLQQLAAPEPARLKEAISIDDLRAKGNAAESTYELDYMGQNQKWEADMQSPQSPYGPYSADIAPLSSLMAYPARPNFANLVGALVHETAERHARDRTSASGVCVAACGPVGMVSAVSDAVRGIDADQRRVIGGIEFEEECFQY